MERSRLLEPPVDQAPRERKKPATQLLMCSDATRRSLALTYAI